MKTHLLRLIAIIFLLLVHTHKSSSTEDYSEEDHDYSSDPEDEYASEEAHDDDDYNEHDDEFDTEEAYEDDDYEDEDHHEEVHDPVVEEPVVETHDDPNHPHISFETGSEEEHLHNFKRISEDLKLFEDEYIACLDEIHDEDFSESAVEGCLGKDFIKLQLDVKYETMKIISRAEDKLRHFFIYHCYILAGEDEIQALSCDLLQKDMLDAMWNCMDFIELADMNKAKYIEEYAVMPPARFKDILANLGNLHKEFFELVEEVDSHKQVTLLRIKTHIDERTKILVRMAERDQRRLVAPSIVTHTIKIQEKVKDPNFRLVNSLPKMGFLADGSPDPMFTLYAKDVNLNGLDNRGEKDNRLRMLNSSRGYEGLHSANREGNKSVRSTNMSLKQNYRRTVGRLRDSIRSEPIAFRNTHTAYLKGVKKRFK